MTKTPKRPRELNQGAKRTVDIATSEMSDREPTSPTSGENVANALDRWDEEGGAPAVPWPLPAEAQLFAFAALRALDGAGFDIVPKKDKPDADRP